VEVLKEGCFEWCESLVKVIFEVGSQCRRIEKVAFNCCGLPAICIPASVEGIGDDCFSACEFLASIAFEDGSRLQAVGNRAFCGTLLFPQKVHLPKGCASYDWDW
jgi:hypothetical protein